MVSSEAKIRNTERAHLIYYEAQGHRWLDCSDIQKLYEVGVRLDAVTLERQGHAMPTKLLISSAVEQELIRIARQKYPNLRRRFKLLYRGILCEVSSDQ